LIVKSSPIEKKGGEQLFHLQRLIADPADPGRLDIVGFDTAMPQLTSDFARGSL
jgi:hypothetical protein